MQQRFQRCLLLSAAAGLSVVLAYGQDSPSMGDVARQARQQKQSKDAQSKAAPTTKTPKVITNEEIPESPEAADGASTSEDEGHAPTSAPSASGGCEAVGRAVEGSDSGAKEHCEFSAKRHRQA